MRYGVIYIRANTILFMMADYEDGIVRSIKKHFVTGIFTAQSKQKSLSNEGMTRALDKMALCLSEAASSRAEPLVFASSGLAPASNLLEFLALCKQKLGVSIEVLTPEAEAEAVFLGAAGKDGRVIDVGESTTSLVMGSGGNVSKVSLVPLGHENAMMQFGSADDALFRLRNWILDKQGDLLREFASQNSTVYAVSGTATTMAVLSRFSSRYSSELVHGQELKANSMAKTSELLGTMSINERMQLPILYGRAEIIRYGAAILLACMEGMGVTSVRVSDCGAMEGYLIRKAEK